MLTGMKTWGSGIIIIQGKPIEMYLYLINVIPNLVREGHLIFVLAYLSIKIGIDIRYLLKMSLILVW